MKLLYDLFLCIITYCTDDETFVCNLTLPVALFRKNYTYMHKAFVNMVLTEEDEIAVPLCLVVIAMQHLALLTFLCL